MGDNIFEKALLDSWEVHRKAFGPILDPAFKENPQVRITLTAALNHISRRETKRGYEILQSIKDQCIYDEDKAAWAFFVGLCFEMSGVSDQMLLWYERAGKYGHRFYLPYLKLAKTALNDANFELARKYYLIGIDCLIHSEKEFQNEAVIASTYTNLCSCLTSMHLYTDAVKAWQEAQKYPQQPAAYATAAILYAAMDDKDMVTFYIDALRKAAPNNILAFTQKTTDEIINGTHAHFCRVAVDDWRIREFWQWFIQIKDELIKQLRGNEKDDAILKISLRIKEVFPFLDRMPKLTAEKEGIRLKLFFADSYAISLHCGYSELISACPKELLNCLTLILVH